MLILMVLPRDSLIFDQVLPDTVKDDDGIGEGVTGQGKQGGDHQQGDFFVQEIKNSQDRQNVVKCGDGGSDAEDELKPPGQINDNSQH